MHSPSLQLSPSTINLTPPLYAAQAERALSDQLKQAYINPALADKAREDGNVEFKVRLHIPFPSSLPLSSLYVVAPMPSYYPTRQDADSLFLHQKKGDFAASVALYAESIKRNPSDPRGYTNRAAALTKLMALPEALKDTEKAIEVDPDFVKGYIRKSHVLFAMKEFGKSMSAIEQVRQLVLLHSPSKSTLALREEFFSSLRLLRDAGHVDELLTHSTSPGRPPRQRPKAHFRNQHPNPQSKPRRIRIPLR